MFASKSIYHFVSNPALIYFAIFQGKGNNVFHKSLLFF